MSQFWQGVCTGVGGMILTSLITVVLVVWSDVRQSKKSEFQLLEFKGHNGNQKIL